MVLPMMPTPVISVSITSPALRSSGGLRAKPTPAGVPDAMMSPGSSVSHLDSSAIIRGAPARAQQHSAYRSGCPGPQYIATIRIQVRLPDVDRLIRLIEFLLNAGKSKTKKSAPNGALCVADLRNYWILAFLASSSRKAASLRCWIDSDTCVLTSSYGGILAARVSSSLMTW